MFQLHIQTNKGTRVADKICQEASCILGKDDSCFVQLHGWRIGKEHIRFTRTDDGLFVSELTPRSGLRVNGNAVETYGPLQPEDLIPNNGQKSHQAQN